MILGPDDARWTDMKYRAYAELFEIAKRDFQDEEQRKVEASGTITYSVRARRNRMEQSSLRFIPSDRSDRDRISDLIKRTYGLPYMADICPRCGQDRNVVLNCRPSAGFRREGFVSEPVPVKMTFDESEVIDGEVLPVDQAELEE